MGIIVSGMFLPDWLAFNFYIVTLYIPPMPIFALVGGIVGLMAIVFVEYMLSMTNAGQTRPGEYAYHFPNPNPKAVPSPRLQAIWNDPDYKAAFNRVYG